MSKTRWHDWLWIAMIVYLLLPLGNIMFAWLGLVFMIAPIAIAVGAGSKAYCNTYCGRGQLYQLLGGRLKASRDAKPPRFLRASWFRHGFLALFAIKFGMMIHAAYSADSPFAAHAASGIYMAMLATTILGVSTMILFKPRSWCVYCPMGTMTQEICRLRHGKEASHAGTRPQSGGIAESPGKRE